MDAEFRFTITRGFWEYTLTLSLYWRWFSPLLGWRKGVPSFIAVAPPGNTPGISRRVDIFLIRGGPIVMNFFRREWKRWDIRKGA